MRERKIVYKKSKKKEKQYHREEVKMKKKDV
jgi:hypothetical protein